MPTLTNAAMKRIAAEPLTLNPISVEVLAAVDDDPLDVFAGQLLDVVEALQVVVHRQLGAPELLAVEVVRVGEPFQEVEELVANRRPDPADALVVVERADGVLRPELRQQVVEPLQADDVGEIPLRGLCQMRTVV